MNDVLFISGYPPEMSHLGGGSIVDQRLIHALRQAYEVEVFAVCQQAGSQHDVPLQVRESASDVARTLRRMIFRREPYLAAKFRMSANWTNRIAAVQEAARGRRLIASQWPSALLCFDAGLAPQTYVGHNIESKLADLYDPRPFQAIRNAHRTRHLEMALLSEAKTAWMLSPSDTKAAEAMGANAQLLQIFDRAPDVPKELAAPLRLGLIGKASWPPNREAIGVLIHRVLAQVNAPRDPSEHVQLVLAGVGSEEWSGLPNVHALGKVSQLEDFYAQVDLVALPRLGESSGVSIKLLEAVEHGKRIICPNDIAQNMSLPPDYYYAANSAEEMVDVLSSIDKHVAPTARTPLPDTREAFVRSLRDLA